MQDAINDPAPLWLIEDALRERPRSSLVAHRLSDQGRHPLGCTPLAFPSSRSKCSFPTSSQAAVRFRPISPCWSSDCPVVEFQARAPDGDGLPEHSPYADTGGGAIHGHAASPIHDQIEIPIWGLVKACLGIDRVGARVVIEAPALPKRFSNEDHEILRRVIQARSERWTMWSR